MKRKIFTAAVIGTGRIGFSLGFDRKREQPASHTMALNSNRRIRLIAGCDKDSSRLEKWRKANRKCRVYSESSQLFACEKPDIVVVSVNEDSHLETCLEAIRSKPLLVILEKPVALNFEEGDKIRFASESLGVPVMVNHERRFSEDYRFAKNHLDSVGKIMTVNARLDSGLRVYAPENEKDGGYSLLHDGTHLVDIVRFLLDGEKDFEEKKKSLGEKNPGGEKLSCGEKLSGKDFEVIHTPRITSLVYDEKNTEVLRNLSVNFESEICPDVNLSFSGRSKYFGFEVDIIGTEGRIKIGNGIFEFFRAEESRLYSGFYSLSRNRKIRRFKKTRYFSNMVQNAVDFLDGKTPLFSNLCDGLADLKIIGEIKEVIL